jgi:hypothetical protein
MRELKLYDAARNPPNWMQIVQPGEFAVFHRDAASGAMADSAGRLFAPGEETCVLFPSFAAAESYCRNQVLQAPSLRCEIFDAAGRTRPPLRVVVNPALEKKLEVTAVSARNKLVLGTALCLASLLFFYLDYRGEGSGSWFLFTLIGINLALGGFRVILWGLGVREQVRAQEQRRGEIVRNASQSAASGDR